MLTVAIYRPSLAALNLPTVAPIEVHVLDDGRVVANYDGAASALYDSLDALCRSTATGPGTTPATPAEIRDTILAAVVPDAKTDSPLVQHYDATGLANLLTLHEREYGELPKGWSDPVQVTELWQRSTGAVEADLVVSIDGVWVAGEVTLHPDQGQPTVGRRHPLGTCGSPLEFWASDSLVAALDRAFGAFGASAVIDSIVKAVDGAAAAAGL